jgi:hypothetical protein
LKNDYKKDLYTLINESDLFKHIDKFEKCIYKPQVLIKDNPEYYIARDILTNTVYICYKHLLVLDIDNYKLDSNVSDNDILLYLSTLNKVFDIYKTSNGYHAFCISNTFDYNTLETLEYMNTHKSDKFYNIYSHLRGFCVRLNKKLPEFCNQKREIYTYLGRSGTGTINKHLLKLSNLHYKLLDSYKNFPPVSF